MKRVLLIALVIFIALAAVAGYFAWVVYGPFVKYPNAKEFRIRSGWTMQQVAEALGEGDQGEKFAAWMNRLGYEKVRPGFIVIPPKSSLFDVAAILKANRHQTRNLIIKGGWDARNLSEAVAAVMEVDKDSLMAMLNQPGEENPYGWNDTSWPAHFIPNTYNFYVADGMKTFLQKMKKEYDRFWNDNRKSKAAKQNLSSYQVAIIASIVSKESNMTAEYENIAGVYLNRLRKGMLLQADPTVVYARGRSGRVLGADLKIPSPYNTYLHKGLPPGPICIPNVASYDAVLNYGHHDYLYFCARADFSGYHSFAATWEAHLVNARAFHKALDAKSK